jgi:hypothetical protein
MSGSGTPGPPPPPPAGGAPPAAPPAGPAIPPLVINGNPPTRQTRAIDALSTMPVTNTVTMRSGERVFLAGTTRMPNEEAWAGTERGTVANPACEQCRRGAGPFTLCCTVDGLFRGACTNCHYGGSGNRCSFRQSMCCSFPFISVTRCI